MAAGILYVTATPIGNLKDITLRALDTLKSSDLILSEDTRETGKLLNYFGLKIPQISYRDQNHDIVFLRILNDLLSGKILTLVSDSGTPLISDPGFKLIRELRQNNFTNIYSLPGPSALTSALSISGLPSDKFMFLGFLPKKSQDRKAELAIVKDLPATLAIYESPARLIQLLTEIHQTLGNRYVAVCSELTKLNESVEIGLVLKLISSFEETLPKGEYTVLVAKEGYTNE